MTSPTDQDVLRDGLARMMARLDPAATGISALRRLSGGASQETWSFALEGPGTPLILRRAPASRESDGFGVGHRMEAALMARAAAEGAPVPRIVAELGPEDRLGAGFVMSRIEGETLPKRIFRDDDFAPARAAFAGDIGQALAAIHRADMDGIELRTMDPEGAVDWLVRRHKAVGDVRPVFEIALRHLARTAPKMAEAPCLVHGDFRMGNLMFAPDGLAAVLDWELAFRGDRHADLGWFCMESWRFGGKLPAGGLARREDVFAAYEAAGGRPVDPAAVAWWELWGGLCWGVITEEMGNWIRTGEDVSVERHVIGRRASETELILMAKLTGRAD